MNDRTITTWGTATRSVVPDVAVWSAVVRARRPSVRDAYSACAEALTALHAHLSDAAGPEARISAGGISVWPAWDDARSRQTGYEATGRVRIRAAVDEASRLGQSAMDEGADELDDPVYEVSDLTRIRDDLAADAVRSARARAEIMAGAAGVRVGGALLITDDAAETAVPFPTPRGVGSPAARAMAVAPVLAPESDVITAAVRVTFAMLEDDRSGDAGV